MPKMSDVLNSCRVIAVVGLSARRTRPSYGVSEYMQRAGYRIIPVNPNEAEILGEKVYSTLESVPIQIDIVNIFRKSEFVMPIVESAIRVRAKAIWMQEGVINEEAARKARAAGLEVVMDRCILKEHRKLKLQGEAESPTQHSAFSFLRARRTAHSH